MSKQEGAGSFIDPTLSCAKEDRYLDRYDPDVRSHGMRTST